MTNYSAIYKVINLDANQPTDSSKLTHIIINIIYLDVNQPTDSS